MISSWLAKDDPFNVIAGVTNVPVNVGFAFGALLSNDVCKLLICDMLKVLFVSEVLLTLPKPTIPELRPVTEAPSAKATVPVNVGDSFGAFVNSWVDKVVTTLGSLF